MIDKCCCWQAPASARCRRSRESMWREIQIQTSCSTYITLTCSGKPGIWRREMHLWSMCGNASTEEASTCRCRCGRLDHTCDHTPNSMSCPRSAACRERPLLATFLHLPLPIWVFLLTFLLLHPPHGFFRSYILFLTHSSPHFSTSRFQFGFFCLLSYSYAHRVGFSGLIFSSAPTSLCHMIYFRKKSRTFILLSCV